MFHHKRHPQEMSGTELEGFLIHLAVEEHVTASTQNQALNAVVFSAAVLLAFASWKGRFRS